MRSSCWGERERDYEVDTLGAEGDGEGVDGGSGLTKAWRIIPTPLN
jgi:hypothetical protein